MVRTRWGVTIRKMTATTGSAKSQPRLWPMRASPASRTAAPTKTARTDGPTSRRDPSTTHGQKAADQSAALALA